MTSPEQQEQHVKAWQGSGLTQVAYCREHGLNSKIFGNLLRAYRVVQKHNQRTSLIPVTYASATSITSMKRSLSSFVPSYLMKTISMLCWKL
ncbi:hypothetical protein SAMN05216326_1604 [Nitrosomonas marina]|uniref:Transposase n=1 Tax=Nitrosomonas marina TaxID=917 RepID=A0A1I0GBZ7_9PROT|nr:hypothetical protein SAMN05216326_1604 [Nitrosomonas marina]